MKKIFLIIVAVISLICAGSASAHLRIYRLFPVHHKSLACPVHTQCLGVQQAQDSIRQTYTQARMFVRFSDCWRTARLVVRCDDAFRIRLIQDNKVVSIDWISSGDTATVKNQCVPSYWVFCVGKIAVTDS